MSNALHDAREFKHLIEQELTQRLEEFNKQTGLHIEDIGIETIEITGIGNETPQYTYRVWTDIRVK